MKQKSSLLLRRNPDFNGFTTNAKAFSVKPKKTNKRKQKDKRKKTIKKYGGKKDILFYIYPRILQPPTDDNEYSHISKYINRVLVLQKEDFKQFLNDNMIDVEEYLNGVQKLFKENPKDVYPTIFYNKYSIFNKNEKPDDKTKDDVISKGNKPIIFKHKF